MSDDYYSLLGVPRDADDRTLKSAYRRIAMECHPDRNPGDAEAEKRFKQINEAYEILKDPQKRAAYDQYGKAAFEQGGFRDSGFGSGQFSDIFENIFEEFMGGASRGHSSGRERGADLRYDLELTLEEAFSGKETAITFPITTTCEDCSGSGAEPGKKPETCQHCQGSGKQRIQQGFFMMERTCPICRGQGQIITDPCKTCSGQGQVHKDKSLKVNIPAGVDQDTRIRLSNEGASAPRGGPSGDLYIFIHLKAHKLYQRDGSTLYCSVPLSVARASLGGSIDVPCLDGTRAQVKIPAGTQNGRQFAVRGQGMPAINGRGRGDLIVTVEVEVPVNLTNRQKELMVEFLSLETGDNSPQSTGFFEKIRDYFEGRT